MDIVKIARELGKAIQEDERYARFDEAKKDKDADMELNSLIGKLNLIQMSYQHESENNRDENKMKEYDEQFNKIYDEIMKNETMINYEAAREELDNMMSYIVNILTLCVNGEDPETCEPSPGNGCGGNCASCSEGCF